MKLIPIILFVACSIGMLQAQNPATKAVDIDLKKLDGTWHEISRLPNPVDSDLHNVTITYDYRSDKKIKQTLQGFKDNGKKAKLKDILEYQGNGILQGPLGGEYVILNVDPNYEYFMMGTPDHKYLWIMSRKPVMDNNTYNTLVSKADNMGYAILLMQLTAQQ
ncbi:MAG: lipocalin family protein [Sphingobacteriales bacterium JAD_PAG50586_3]|nr:MAG: lipocalin family protein [Sphingobacteriales bacterium JAD_PAG50586_3]